MKRGMLAVLLLVLMVSSAWGVEHWYRYQGTLSGNWRWVTGESFRGSQEYDVLVCYETTPWSISLQVKDTDIVVWSGELDKEKTKLYFWASSVAADQKVVGRGSFNAKYTALNLQGHSFYRSVAPGSRACFVQYRFRGQFVDVVTKP